MFFYIISAFILGLLIGLSIRSAKNSSGGKRRVVSKQPSQTETDFNYQEFIGFPLSPAMKKFNRELEISTELTAEFLRNQNVRRALKIKQERQDLFDESRPFFSGKN